MAKAVTYLTVDDNSAGQRLDNFLLHHLKGVPKSHVYRIVRSGEVRVNKGRADVAYRLVMDDLVRIPPVRIADEKAGMLPQGARGDILRDIAAQLGEFTALVGDLVHLSREDGPQAAREPVDLADLIANGVTRAKRRGPSLHFEVDLQPLYLVGEPDTLERAFTNLLDNAVKFSPPGGTVRVQMDGQTIRISDEGPGIAEEDLPHIFERFYRSDRARNTPGTGLGLSIVAHTINSHGGWVKAGQAKSGGAEFTVVLPGEPELADLDDEQLPA